MSVADARELLERQLAAIAEREADVQAFVPGTFDADRVRADFEAAAERDPSAPLLGHLLGVKDIIHADGLPTRGGTTIDPAEWAGPQASTVTALVEAGAVVAGKTVTAELACWKPGPTRNPHRLGHTPGGSSAGSAAGVGAGFFTIGFATQTYGSTIRPATFCGAVGWKPTRGRLALDGTIPYSASIDHLGFITPDLDVLEAVLPHAQDDWSPVDAEPIRRLAVPVGAYLDRLADGAEGFAAARRPLADAGIEIVEVPTLDDVAEIGEMIDALSYAEAADVHAGRMDLIRAHCDPDYTIELERHRGMSAADRDTIRDRRHSLQGELDGLLDSVEADAWLTPSAPGVAPEGITASGDPTMQGAWTLAGVPAITIPHGTGRHELPLGLQFVGRHGDDERLVSQMGTLPL